MRTSAEKRHNDWHKAIRKKRISDIYCNDSPWYDNLHQYSKNKIHCSCPLCSCKTRNKNNIRGRGENWSMADLKQINDIRQQLIERLE